MEKKFTTFEELVVLAPTQVQEVLGKLKEVRERPDYHPEGSAYEHIKIVTTRLMSLTTGGNNLVIAGLYHDLGKIETMKENPKTGHIMTPGHEHVSASWVKRDGDFIISMGCDLDFVYNVVKNHMKIKQFDKMGPKKKREMESDYELFHALQIFTKADDMLNEFKF